MTVINLMNQGNSESWTNQIRIFKNTNNVRYRNIVHNRLVGYRSTDYYPIHIYHHGYNLSKEQWRAKFDRTSTLLKKQIQKEPHAYKHRHDLAACYLSIEDYQRAIDEGKKAIEIAKDTNRFNDPLLLWTHFIVAFSYLKLGNLDNAINYSLIALSKFENHLDSLFILSCSYHQKGDWEKCTHVSERYLNVLSELKRNPKLFGNVMHNTIKEEWRIHMALGNCELQRGNVEKARNLFSKAKATAPDQGECFKMIGDFFIQSSLWKDAEENHIKVTEIYPSVPDSFVSLASIYWNTGDRSKYNDTVDKLKKLNIKDENHFRELGTLELMAGNYDSAGVFFERLLDAGNYDPAIFTNLALCYKHLGRLEEAVSYNKKALEIDPRHLEALANLGHIYFETGQNFLAIEHYQQMRKQSSNLVDINLRLSILHILNGDIDAALEPLDSLLHALNIPTDITLDSLSDLVGLLNKIAEALATSGKKVLAFEAARTAAILAGNISPQFTAHLP